MKRILPSTEILGVQFSSMMTAIQEHPNRAVVGVQDPERIAKLKEVMDRIQKLLNNIDYGKPI